MDRQKINTYAFEDRDIIAMAQDDKDVVVSIFFIRQGKLLGREHFHMEADEESSKDFSGLYSPSIEEFFLVFIAQYHRIWPWIFFQDRKNRLILTMIEQLNPKFLISR